MRRVAALLLILASILCLRAQTKMRIWEGTNVHARSVTLTAYLPTEDGKKHIAVIVCPGGSYFWHDTNTEGNEVARWLQRNGIAAFVLHYRTAGGFAFASRFRYIFRGNQYPDPQNDLRRSVTLIQANAEHFQVDINKLGAMGFSAGGHLVVSVPELDGAEKSGLSFIAPIYPVVTFVHPCMHKRSRRALLGEWRKRNKALCDSLSIERHVRKDLPPVFLVNCKDDPIVKYRNSELLDSALTAIGVPHKYIQYRTGGHGFGASEIKGTAESRQWRGEFLKWIHQLFPL